jgi:hypothetical protein
MALPASPLAQPVLHLRFAGRSAEVPLAALRLSMTSSDQQIKQAAARFLDQPPSALDSYVIVRHDRAIVARPEAIYG